MDRNCHTFCAKRSLVSGFGWYSATYAYVTMHVPDRLLECLPYNVKRLPDPILGQNSRYSSKISENVLAALPIALISFRTTERATPSAAATWRCDWPASRPSSTRC